MNIEDGGEQLTNVEDIYRTLKSLQLTRSQLTVKIAGDRSSYASLLVDVDLKRRHFFIDELIPESGNERISKGEPFTIIALYEGIQVILRGSLSTAKNRHHIDHAFNLSFPNYIYHKQRRHAFRASVRPTAPSEITLRTNQREQILTGQLIDLSTSGAGVQFTGFIKPEIQKQEYFENCLLKVDNEFNLHCGLVAKHPLYHKALDVCNCGFQFCNLNPYQQKTVDRYVLTIQRQARKHRLNQQDRIASAF